MKTPVRAPASADASGAPAPPGANASSGAPAVPVHDFTGKLRQPSLLGRVADYVTWRRAVRAAATAGASPPPVPDLAPLSINLDLTTACNYACDHCIDWDVLNGGTSHDEAKLLDSLALLAERGLRSVILIGGGEPTVHPGFRRVVERLKDLGLQVAVVSNGSRNERLLDVAHRLDEGDWVRLSLDAGTDATFQRMHRPKKPITLEAICAGVPPIKAANPRLVVGFSFLVTWAGASREPGAPVESNLDEIPLAARLARDHGFDYVTFKPFLVRGDGGSEVMDPTSAREGAALVARIRARVEEAKAFASPTFRVLESTNLRVLEAGTWRDWTRQPRTCHFQALRQVLSPLGLYNCPAHRGVEKARIAGRDAYADADAARATAEATAAALERFDASHECREITCLYHGANWWLEEAIADDRDLAAVDAGPEALDAFL